VARNLLIEFRRGLAAGWTATNPVLAAGEPGFETDTGKLKIGDGATAWVGLAYVGAGTGITSLASSGGTIGITNPGGPVADLDLPASGVGAGSYGDATHVPQVTIGADGIISAATAIAIAGGAANLTVLFDSTLGANAASIDTGANGIAQTTSHLIILYTARTTEAVVVSTANMTINGDTAANYDRQTLRARSNVSSSGAVAAATSISLNVPGSSVAAGHFAGAFMFIPAYRQTVTDKMIVEAGGWADTNIANGEAHINTGIWRNTVAVNQLTLTAGSGNLVTGSRLTIYGSG
jgi:hypothetical protein